jgi:hypothetical protein
VSVVVWVRVRRTGRAAAGPVAAARVRLPELCRGGGLQDAAAGAFRDGQTLLCRAGCTVLVDQVTVRSLSAYRRGPSLIVPVRWVATGPGRDLCPPLDADLELDPTPGRNQPAPSSGGATGYRAAIPSRIGPGTFSGG